MDHARARGVLSGGAVPGLAGFLGFAGTPAFAAMALWTYLSGGRPDVLCGALDGGSPFTGMGAMYVLMSVFHAGPWLMFLARKPAGR